MTCLVSSRSEDSPCCVLAIYIQGIFYLTQIRKAVHIPGVTTSWTNLTGKGLRVGWSCGAVVAWRPEQEPCQCVDFSVDSSKRTLLFCSHLYSLEDAASSFGLFTCSSLL